MLYFHQFRFIFPIFCAYICVVTASILILRTRVLLPRRYTAEHSVSFFVTIRKNNRRWCSSASSSSSQLVVRNLCRLAVSPSDVRELLHRCTNRPRDSSQPPIVCMLRFRQHVCPRASSSHCFIVGCHLPPIPGVWNHLEPRIYR